MSGRERPWRRSGARAGPEAGGVTRRPRTVPAGPSRAQTSRTPAKQPRCLSGPSSEPPAWSNRYRDRFLRLEGFSVSNSPNTRHDHMTTPALFLEQFRLSPGSASLAETSPVRVLVPPGHDGGKRQEGLRPTGEQFRSQILALIPPHSEEI